MSCCNKEIIPNADCPVCGKKEGAFISASIWGHSVTCCSDLCGLLLRDKFEKLRESKDMVDLQNRLSQTKNLITQMVEKVAGTTRLHFELDKWI